MVARKKHSKALVKKSKTQRKHFQKQINAFSKHNKAKSSDVGINKDKKGRGRFHAGIFWSKKMEQGFQYRSAYEVAYFHILEQDDTVESYLVEPFHIPYRWQNKVKRYFPDIIIWYSDGNKEIIEIKPKNLRFLPQVQAKARATKEYIKKKLPGSKYRFVSEEDIFNSPEDYRKFLKIIRDHD